MAMRRCSRLVPAWCLLSVLLLGLSAEARKPRLRIERIDGARCGAGAIEVHGVEVELEGVLRPRRLSEYRLVIDGKQGGRPERATTFGKSSKPLYVVFLVQVSESYGKALEAIRRGLEQLLAELPRETRYALLAYHAEVEQLTARAPKRRASTALDRLQRREGTTDLALLSGLRRALTAALASPVDARRLLIVISDGMDRMPDWGAFRSLGKRALKAGVPIFPLAYSPIDERGPLLNLGEIAKRSRGMLRWARRVDDIGTQLHNLGRAIKGQLVLTFSVPDRCRVAHQVQLAAGGLLSNTVPLPARGGTLSAKGRAGEVGRDQAPGWSWRWLGLGALLLFAVGALAGMTFWLVRGMRGPKSG